MSPSFSRREFLQGSLLAGSAAAALPGLLARPSAAAATVAGPRVLVVIQLAGGNDGLNTLAPCGAPAYYRARPTLALPADAVLPLEDAPGFGLHPALTDVRELFDAGRAAVVPGVGYPQPNRSHFASLDIWHSADPAGHRGRDTGWLGRAVDELAPARAGTDAPACIAFGPEAPLAALGRHTRPLLLDAAAPASRGVPGSAASFPAGPLAAQLQAVAAHLAAGSPARVYYATLTGFDTHAAQAERHAALLGQFAAAVAAFQRELDAAGQAPRVLTFAFSEFGRRLVENASAGTDHGAAGPAFLFGPVARPGVYDSHPSLAPTVLDHGDLRYTVDFRCLYAALLQNWLGVDSRAVLGRSFAPIAVV